MSRSNGTLIDECGTVGPVSVFLEESVPVLRRTHEFLSHFTRISQRTMLVVFSMVWLVNLLITLSWK